MKSLVMIMAMVCIVASQQQPPLILKQSADINADGTFQYSYETENGIVASESGVLKNAGSPEEAQSVEGSYSYTAPDGTLITVTYTADENGFRAITKTNGKGGATGDRKITPFSTQSVPGGPPALGFHSGTFDE